MIGFRGGSKSWRYSGNGVGLYPSKITARADRMLALFSNMLYRSAQFVLPKKRLSLSVAYIHDWFSTQQHRVIHMLQNTYHSLLWCGAKPRSSQSPYNLPYGFQAVVTNSNHFSTPLPIAQCKWLIWKRERCSWARWTWAPSEGFMHTVRQSVIVSGLEESLVRFSDPMFE